MGLDLIRPKRVPICKSDILLTGENGDQNCHDLKFLQKINLQKTVLRNGKGGYI